MKGANTMDISRSIFEHDVPRSRLDAGSFGTMGVGRKLGIDYSWICDRFSNIPSFKKSNLYSGRFRIWIWCNGNGNNLSIKITHYCYNH